MIVIFTGIAKSYEHAARVEGDVCKEVYAGKDSQVLALAAADDGSVFERTVDWAMNQGIETATFHILTPYPGTALYRRMAAQVLFDPELLRRERPRNDVERHRRLEDLDVVDRTRRLGVTHCDGPNVHPEKVTGEVNGAGSGPRLALTGLAPLAQTAEHFHGKEGVYGSIP